jgi:5-amino-6-(5-phospho-D-ribitylamino)uracil phosphatase
MSTLAPLTVAALDLDDTLLGSDGSLSAHTLTALRKWQAAGRRLVIATGRPHRSVAPVLPGELHNTPIICYNGAEIHVDGHKIFENLIPPDAVRTIVEQVQLAAPSAIVGLEVQGELYLNRAMQRASPYHVADLMEVAAHPAAKVLIFGPELEPVAPLLAELPAAAKALLSARYQFIQILAAGANKAAALAVLMADWGVPLAQVVAFGDDTNDIEMLQECGLGVAVANAVDDVKAVANLVTASNDEEGVALVLEQLLDGPMVV